MPKPTTLKPPTHLSTDASAIWREVVTHLERQGQLLPVDTGVLETYCMAVVRQRRLTSALDDADLLDDDGKPNPLLRTIEATAATVKNLAHVLGLSPLARRALPITKRETSPKEKDPWRGVLK